MEEGGFDGEHRVVDMVGEYSGGRRLPSKKLCSLVLWKRTWSKKHRYKHLVLTPLLRLLFRYTDQPRRSDMTASTAANRGMLDHRRNEDELARSVLLDFAVCKISSILCELASAGRVRRRLVQR